MCNICSLQIIHLFHLLLTIVNCCVHVSLQYTCKIAGLHGELNKKTKGPREKSRARKKIRQPADNIPGSTSADLILLLMRV